MNLFGILKNKFILKRKTVTIKRIIIIQNNESKHYDLFVSAFKLLRDDYNIKIISNKFINNIKEEDFDLIIYNTKNKFFKKRLPSNKVKGVFVENIKEIPKFRSKTSYIFWGDILKTSKPNIIPINFIADEIISNENIVKNISFRIRDGIDLTEGKNNPNSNLLLPKTNLHTGRLSYAYKHFKFKGTPKVYIGSFCSIGEDVTLITENHDTRYLATQGFLYKYFFNEDHPGTMLMVPTRERTKGPIVIKNDIWIGDRVIILSGVTIGNGACIAAGSIVTKDVEPYTIVAGVPAKKIKNRFDENTINLLKDLNWWDWSNKDIIKKRDLFFEIHGYNSKS